MALALVFTSRRPVECFECVFALAIDLFFIDDVFRNENGYLFIAFLYQTY